MRSVFLYTVRRASHCRYYSAVPALKLLHTLVSSSEECRQALLGPVQAQASEGEDNMLDVDNEDYGSDNEEISPITACRFVFNFHTFDLKFVNIVDIFNSHLT